MYDNLNVGDFFTLQGHYKKRSFMEWMRQEPRQLQMYVVKDKNISYMQYEPIITIDTTLKPL